MKKTLVLMIAAVFLFVAVSAYACGDKKTSAQTKAAKAEIVKTDAKGSCGSEAKAQTAGMSSDNCAGAEVQTADMKAGHCTEAKAANADMSSCPVTGKTAKAEMSSSDGTCGTAVKGEGQVMKTGSGESCCGSKATKANDTKAVKASKASSKKDMASATQEAVAVTPVSSAK